MIRRACIIATLVSTAGCLGSPTGKQVGPGLGAWPPEDPVFITSAQVVDVDHDGYDDLALASTIADSAKHGVFILSGGASGFGTRYHARIDTPIEVSPVAFALADVGSSAALDLIVMGGSPSRATLLAYPATTPLTFGEPLRRDTTDFGINPADVIDPVFTVRVDNLEGDAVPDLLVAAGGSVYTAPIPALEATAFEELELVQAPGPTSTLFANVKDIYTVPNGDARDLWVDDTFESFVFPGGVLTEGNRKATANEPENHEVSARADLDGDGVPEQIGGYSAFLGLTRPFPIGEHTSFRGEQLLEYGTVFKLVVDAVDNDSAGRLDAVFYDRPQGEEQDELQVLPQLRFTDDTIPTFDSIAAGTLAYHLPIDLVGEVLVTGEFDGVAPREILVIGHNGRIACFHVDIDSFDDCIPP